MHVTDLGFFHFQNDAFVFYSGYTEEQMLPGHQMLVEKLTEAGFDRQYVFKKYANKKFLKAAVFALDWAQSHIDEQSGEQMMLEN
jgi:phosphohistidine phosphatase SixA